MIKSAVFFFVSMAVAFCNGKDTAAAEHALTRSPICTRRNSYYPIEGSCDAYIECRDYYAQELFCPDGLHYNAETVWPSYPCGYPTDVPCRGRSSLQQAISNAECPHLYGFYPSPLTTPSNCGQYRMCVEGRPTEMSCPAGLAFDPASGRCDWPDAVPSCNADAFLGFKCPEIPVDSNGQPLDVVLNYRYEGHCHAFFSCEHGRARLLSCDAGLAFDQSTGRCEDATRVNCGTHNSPRLGVTAEIERA